MAALEDSPTRCQGQSWTQWAQRVGLSLTIDEVNEMDGTMTKNVRDQREGDSMKLRKEDMSLFGFCPARDEFYLVVCELCRQVVKPQALQNHIELRHSNSVASKVVSCSSSQEGSVPGREVPFQLHYHHNHWASRAHSSTSSSSETTTARDKTCSTTTTTTTSPAVVSHPTSSSSSCASSSKSNVALQPQMSTMTTNSNSGGGRCKLESKAIGGVGSPLSNVKKSPSPSSPIVRVERMPPCLITKNVNSTVGGMGPPMFMSSAIPVDKRELPSPQQPPPVQEATPASFVHRHNSVSSSSSSSSSSWSNPLTAGSSIGGGSGASCSQPASLSLSTCAAQQAVNNKVLSASPGDNRPKPSSKSKSKVPKERKLLPCKDRVYDPDKHCGVFIQEIGKQCTRSLTCKTHSLATRRSVLGRKKNFDELLADHRAAKEAVIKATKGSVPSSSTNTSCHATSNSIAVGSAVCKNDVDVASSSACSSSGQTNTTSASKKAASDILRLNHMNSSSGGGGIHLAENGSVAQQRLISPVSSHCAGNKTKSTSTRSASSLNTLLPRPFHSSVSSDAVSLLAGSNLDTPHVVEDCGYVARHPRPAAVCTFNSRQMGLGFFVYDRRFDNIRAILRTSLGERLSQPPPVKKLCVESRLPPVPEPTDPSDPYCFLVSDQQSTTTAVTVGETTSKVQTAAVTPSRTFTPVMMHPLKSGNPTKGSAGAVGGSVVGKSVIRPKNKHSKRCVSCTTTTNAVSGGTNAVSCPVVSSVSIGTLGTNHVTVTSGEASAMLPLVSRSNSSNSGDPLIKRKRVSANKVVSGGGGGGGSASTAIRTTAQQVVGITTTTTATPTTGLLPISFPISLNAQLAAAVPHLASGAKNGSIASPLVIPVCSSSLVTNVAKSNNNDNNASGVVNSSKDLNLVMEVMNGQVAHGPSSTVLPRTSTSAMCLPVTTSDTIKGSLSSLGLGLTPPTIALTTLSTVSNRASFSCSTSTTIPVSTLRTSTTTTADSAHGRSSSSSSSTKRVRSSAPSRASKVESITTSTTLASTTTETKWNLVNSTAVLTGFGSLSNAAMLGGMLAAKNHVTMPSAVNSSSCQAATQHSGQIAYRNIRLGSSSPHVTSSPYISNGLGSTLSAALVEHKGLPNHGLSSNSPSSFTASPRSCSNSPSSDLSSPNSEGQNQSRGKGRVNATACRVSSGKKNVYQQHITHACSGTTTTTTQVILGKGSTSAMSSPSLSAVIGLGNLNVARSTQFTASVAKHASDDVSFPPSQPFNLPSSIPLKMLSASSSSSVIASTASNKTHNSKPFSIPVEEFHRPSEVRDSPT